MRHNTPVTLNEIALDDGMTIVSTTDLKGNITYANPYFVQISGYDEHELIGAPQNILRHPDMPVEAFADLWATIQRGLSWSGVVKNRCKNGDFYWVLANVTPVMENDRVVGYMSVRTRPSREQVQQAAELYGNLRQGDGLGLALHEGHLVKAGSRTRLRTALTLRKWPLNRLLSLNALLPVLTMLSCIGMIWMTGGLAPGARNCLTGMAALSLVLVLYIRNILQDTVISPLHQAQAALTRMAGGDLSVEIESAGGHELGRLMTTLRQVSINLSSVIGDIRNNLTHMAHASEEIEKGNLDLSARTESQASHLEETAASMEELTSTVKQNEAHVDMASQLTSQAEGIAQQGGAIVGDVVATMGDIRDSSSRISEIIGLIDGIAFQTNILALNAAVEAARAGDHGRGFAVVATEVRNLAQRSATAAREIKSLIDVSIEKVRAGTALTDDAGANMAEVISAVNRVTQVIREISVATHEQSGGIGQAAQALTEMDGISQQNAALAEQTAAAVVNLAQQAHHLAAALAIFKLVRTPALRRSRSVPAIAGS